MAAVSFQQKPRTKRQQFEWLWNHVQAEGSAKEKRQDSRDRNQVGLVCNVYEHHHHHHLEGHIMAEDLVDREPQTACNWSAPTW